MKKYCYIVFFFISVTVAAQFNPQSKKITEKFFPDFDFVENVTPALKKKKGYTTDTELYAFLDEMCEKHPKKVQLSYIGESQKGKKIPLVRLTNPNENEKIKVFIQGGLHGNEPGSTESVLYLIYNLLNNEMYTDLLDHIDLALIPMANIDGYIKGDRYAANGLDLNRDQTKLMAKETVLIKTFFSSFSPEVAIDFHEYTPFRKDFAKLGSFGVTNVYDVMFLYSGNLNIPENLRHITETKFVKNAISDLSQHKLRAETYITSTKYKGELQIKRGSVSSRSSATNYGLTNAISSLIEIRGVGLQKTSFKRRIYSAFLVATSYLKTTVANKKLIKDAITEAISAQHNITVTSKRKVYDGQVHMLDIDKKEIVALDMTIRDASESKANITRSKPKAYIIEAGHENLIEKIKILGIQVTELQKDTPLQIESYKIKTYKKRAKKYQKMTIQDVSVKLIKSKKTLPKGSYIVSLNQKNANLLVELIEPEAPNSFVSFGLIKTEENAILPIHRLIN